MLLSNFFLVLISIFALLFFFLKHIISKQQKPKKFYLTPYNFSTIIGILSFCLLYFDSQKIKGMNPFKKRSELWKEMVDLSTKKESFSEAMQFGKQNEDT